MIHCLGFCKNKSLNKNKCFLFRAAGTFACKIIVLQIIKLYITLINHVLLKDKDEINNLIYAKEGNIFIDVPPKRV